MTQPRPYTPDDAPAFAALLSLGGRSTSADDLLATDARRAHGDQPWRRVLTSPDGRVLGGAQVQRSLFIPPDFLHVSVLVFPEARGRGVGETLWQAARQEALGQQAQGLSVDVPDGDPADRAWAERRGFTLRAHRFASELDLRNVRVADFQPALDGARAQGVTFTDLRGADDATLRRYVEFVADRLMDTPDLSGYPRWTSAQVREILRLESDPRPDWLMLAVGPDGEWLGTTVMVRFRHLPFVYNELTALHPSARRRGLALPLKLQAVQRAQAEGHTTMRTNNHSLNAPMLAVNRRLGFRALAGRFEMHRLT
ncbi:GNAT family N-acetyltransferase [Deinococcus radiotolerans]|uniref:GNAT family N-acetyltransferase n=1 Tax=Deinococcus radiotolerans TaxID=1309407 RepID=A0ABQ2FK63_9DEIO|nr:GNAT family N-acetyltransferase [Deinococcus radiotolerans]GGL02499.1 GNAT family N-acetyltransferase [Deinococcus radiotolerans]